MVIFGSSNIGKVRKDNQDSYMFYSFDSKNGYAVVCDGMGGTSGGKTASSTAVSSYSDKIIKLIDADSELNTLDIINEAVDCANKNVYAKSLSDESLKGMGTTLVSAVIFDNKCYFVNVGDSRAYLIRNGEIRRMTHDHSAVQELVDQGLLTENQARNHPNKNIITRALGVCEDVKCDITAEEIKEDDFIILCTDGITNYVDDLEIPFEIEKQQKVESVPQKLIELANSRGGADNSTIVIIKIQEEHFNG